MIANSRELTSSNLKVGINNLFDIGMMIFKFFSSLNATLLDPLLTSPFLSLVGVVTLEIQDGISMLLPGNNDSSLATSLTSSLWYKTLRGLKGPFPFSLPGPEIKVYVLEPSSLSVSDPMSINLYSLSLKLIHSSMECPIVPVWYSHLIFG